MVNRLVVVMWLVHFLLMGKCEGVPARGGYPAHGGIPTILDPLQAEEHRRLLGRERGKGPGSWFSRTAGGLGVGTSRAGTPLAIEPHCS